MPEDPLDGMTPEEEAALLRGFERASRPNPVREARQRLDRIVNEHRTRRPE